MSAPLIIRLIVQQVYFPYHQDQGYTYSTIHTMAISTLNKLLGAQLLRRGDGVIALPDSRRKERLLSGRTKLSSQLVNKLETLVNDYQPQGHLY